MIGINKFIGVGCIVQGINSTWTKNGDSMARFKLATTEVYKEKNGDKIERTEFHSVVVWCKLADMVTHRLQTNSQIYIEGRVRYRSFEDNNEHKRFITEIHADVIRKLGEQDHNFKRNLLA